MESLSYKSGQGFLPFNKEPGFQSIRFDASSIPGMDRIEAELYNVLSDSRGAIRDMCFHMLTSGGKRIRPVLVFYGGLMFSGPTDELVYAAVAAELIHMASLVHDDIIDNSFLRRGRPSLNKIWGNHFAVLCGDYLFAKAFEIMARKKLIKCMDYMVEAIENMCQGEIIQAESRFKTDAGIDDYYERISKKTALFLSCCCKAGACISGAGEPQVEKIGEYGLNLGYAFQIIDDILDINGDTGEMGKPRGEDLKQGNITIPVILLLKDSRYGEAASRIISQGNLNDAALESIRGMLRESGAVEKSLDMAAAHIGKARRCLDMLPPSPYSGFLHDLAGMLKARLN